MSARSFSNCSAVRADLSAKTSEDTKPKRAKKENKIALFVNIVNSCSGPRKGTNQFTSFYRSVWEYALENEAHGRRCVGWRRMRSFQFLLLLNFLDRLGLVGKLFSIFFSLFFEVGFEFLAVDLAVLVGIAFL